MMRTAYELQVAGKEFSFPVPSFVVDGRPLAKRVPKPATRSSSLQKNLEALRTTLEKINVWTTDLFNEFLAELSSVRTFFDGSSHKPNYFCSLSAEKKRASKDISKRFSCLRFPFYSRAVLVLASRVFSCDFCNTGFSQNLSGLLNLFCRFSNGLGEVLLNPDTLKTNKKAAKPSYTRTKASQKKHNLSLLFVFIEKSQKEGGSRNSKKTESSYSDIAQDFHEHFFLRVLGWDFLRDSQILPSTAEASARRIG